MRGMQGHQGAPQRQLREADLLYWAQKILGHDSPPALADFCDGVLTVRILQRVLSSEPQTAKALQLALHEPAASLSQRLDNLALADAVLRENGSPGVFGGCGGQGAGADIVDIAQVECGQEEALAQLLLVLYRFYCTKCTSEVRRVKVRAKSAMPAEGSPSAAASRRAGLNAEGAGVQRAAGLMVQDDGAGAGCVQAGGQEKWKGWQDGQLVGLIPIEQTLDLRPEEYQDKFAALAAHACWALGIVSSRAPEVAQCVGGEGVLRQIHLRSGVEGKGGCPAWQRCDWGPGGIWDESGWFRRMCRSGYLYAVLLHLFAAKAENSADVGGKEHIADWEDEVACLERLSRVCDDIKSKGIRLRLEAPQLLEPLASVSSSAHAALLDALALLYVQTLVSLQDIERVIASKWGDIEKVDPGLARRSGFVVEKALVCALCRNH